MTLGSTVEAMPRRRWSCSRAADWITTCHSPGSAGGNAARSMSGIWGRRSRPEQLGLQGADGGVPEVGGRVEQARPEPVAELAGEPDDLVAFLLEDRGKLVRLQAHPVQTREAGAHHPDDHVLPPVLLVLRGREGPVCFLRRAAWSSS